MITMNKMKIIFLSLSFALFSQALWAQGKSYRDIMSLMAKYENIDPTQIDLNQSLTDHEKLYQFTRNFGSFIVEQIQKDQPLTGTQLNLIHISFGQYLKLSDIINSSLEINRYSSSNSFAPIYARIVLAERFKTLYSVYFSDTLLRRIVKDKIMYEKYELYRIEELAQKLLSKDRQHHVEEMIGKLISRYQNSADPYFPRIRETSSYKLVEEGSDLSSLYSTESFWTDRFASVNSGITRSLSWAFGMTAGNIEWRNGFLYNKPEFYQETLKQLKPLDMIFEKRTFKLTDYTIPGNWGHMAVWLGTKEQLEELGIWNHPALDYFREHILKGHSVFQMRRWGLVFDSLENMLNLDETATLRVRDLVNKPTQDLVDIYERLAEQKDKTYDFSFNAMATDRVTCTEIVYLSYGSINWPRERILGRTTIKPDNMAELVLFDNSPLEFISYTTSYDETEINRKTKDDFAQILGYVGRTDERGQKFYEKKERQCERQYFRISGKIRMRNSCQNTFERRTYIKAAEFDDNLD